jgi:uncharacterized protein (DUF4415 family)
MRKTKPLTNAAGDVRELTAADFKRMRPAREVLSKEFLDNWAKGGHTIKHVSDAEYEASKRRGRPKSENPKMPVTVRLDADVVKFFRAGGEGWQTRLNALLAAHVKRASKRTPSRSPKPAKSGRQVA